MDKNKKIALAVIGVLLFLGVISASGGNNEDKTTETSKKQITQEVENNIEKENIEALKVNTSEFIKEYDENQLAAEEKYKGKLVELSGYISNISEGVMGEVYIVLKPVPEEHYFGTNIQCYFDNKSDLLSLKNEQLVTLQGMADTQTLGIIGIKKCKVLHQ